MNWSLGSEQNKLVETNIDYIPGHQRQTSFHRHHYSPANRGDTRVDCRAFRFTNCVYVTNTHMCNTDRRMEDHVHKHIHTKNMHTLLASIQLAETCFFIRWLNDLLNAPLCLFWLRWLNDALIRCWRFFSSFSAIASYSWDWSLIMSDSRGDIDVSKSHTYGMTCATFCKILSCAAPKDTAKSYII